jgi:glutamate---cysteine ligase / carboxylate-amine ligase
VRIPFNASQRSSLGIEWELMLVDRETRELASGASEILPGIVPEGESEHPCAKHELFQSTIEIITGVCSTVREATDDLVGTIAELRPEVERRGLAIMCAGTHPFTDWSTQQISPNERYHKLVHDMQWLARRLQIFGVHVHVGVRSPDKCISFVNALTAYVPHFLALSASSPYWKGNDTGLASARSKIFENLPTAGLPFMLDDWAEFELYMDILLKTKAISSIKEVWWDIRPHPDFGTVELRICDGLPTLSEVGTVAAISQCLVDMFDREIDKGYTLPKPKSWVVRENKWRAARYGMDAEIISGETHELVPVREALLELARDLSPTAERLGCLDELLRVQTLVEGGASYQRQRAVAAASGGDLTAVVDSLIEEFDTDVPVVLGGAAAEGAPGARAVQ